MTVLSSGSKCRAEMLCCIIPGLVMEIKDDINRIFQEEINVLFESVKMKKVLKNFNICAIIKNKKSTKNVVVKTKIYVFNQKRGKSYKDLALVTRTITFYNLSFMIVDIV